MGNLQANEKSEAFVVASLGALVFGSLPQRDADGGELDMALVWGSGSRGIGTHPRSVIAYLHASVASRLVQLDAANRARIVFGEFGLLVACHL